ncbi:MAG: VWA domain-containing protein [Bacteroidota bacterium]
MMKDVTFANPDFFWLFLIIPFLIAWYIFKNRKQTPTIKLSTAEGFNISKMTTRAWLRHLLPVLRIISVSLLIIVLARPQSSSSHKNVTTEGVDIVITLDISSSMLSEDFSPNRLEAAKRTAMKFIDDRVDDRIGLVVFSRESFTQCPVTIDHDVVKNLFQSIKSGMIDDGTAIGQGLATAINRLKDSKAKSKVVILLTDGMNNAGLIAPLSAADIAKTFGVRVYTIGVGRNGFAPYPFKTPFGIQYQNIEVKIDEDLLKSIAKMTDGKYFRATNNKGLENIYKEIDKLEKTRIDVAVFSRRSEKFLPYAIAACAFFALELLLRYLVLRRIP